MDNAQNLVKLVNQLFELEKKVIAKTDENLFARNFNRINDSFSEMGLIVHNPLNEAYNETRTDCDATLTGNSANNLVISEVIKPAVYIKLNENDKHLLQRAVVIVESK